MFVIFIALYIHYTYTCELLQKLNRDTMSFATKLCHIITDGTKR